MTEHPSHSGAAPLADANRVPIVLLVDDVAPYVNLYYHYIRQVELTHMRRPRIAFGPHLELLHDRIPLELLARFAGLVDEFGLRGKLSVVPYPAGLGAIDAGILGVTSAQLRRFLELLHRVVSAGFDVSPEILTHTLRLDPRTGSLSAVSEEQWSATCTADEMEEYLGYAVTLLRNVGFRPTGVTSPLRFGAVQESLYVQAISRVLGDPAGGGACWYFLHETGGRPAHLRPVQPDRMRPDLDCVHIPGTIPDHLMELHNVHVGPGTCREIADRYLTDDGRCGEIRWQLSAGAEMISLVVHWAALYLNGHYYGLKVLREVARRVSRHLADRVAWTAPSELAAYVVRRDRQILGQRA